MKRILFTVSAALGAVSLGFAQAPTVTDVLDAGAYTSTLAQGTVFVVKGTNLCTTSQTTTLPYKTSALSGVTIQLTPVAGGAPISAYMIYTYCQGGVTQLAAVLPSNAAAGDYNVTVTSAGGTSAPFKTTVVARKFGIMTQNGSGSGRALVQNVVSQSQYDLNGFTKGAVPGAGFQRSPAYPGETLIVWGMGLGAATGFDAQAPGSGLDFLGQGLDVKVQVGNKTITPIYAGRSNLFPGLDNVVFTLPSDVQTGCFVPFQVTVAGKASNSATLAIAPNSQASACADPNYNTDTLTRLDAGGGLVVGLFNLLGLNTSASFGGQTFSFRSESISGAFSRFTADQVNEIPNVASLAAGGACQVFRVTSGTAGVATPTDVTNLDAGTITLNGPNVNNRPLTETKNTYSLALTTPPSTAQLIAAGTYTLTGAGGTDIGPFTASVNVNTPLTITGSLPSTVNRGQNLAIAWTGGGTDIVEIVGSSSALLSGNPSNNTAVYDSGTFICTTTADKGSFTVPSSILQQLPATPPPTGSTPNGIGTLSVFTSSVPNANAKNGFFTAPLRSGGNIDLGLFLAGLGTTATPTYQ